MTRTRLAVALLLASALALVALATTVRAQGVPKLLNVEAVCNPPALGEMILARRGLELVRTWTDDRGLLVEEWASPQEQATAFLWTDQAGVPWRCLIFTRSAPGVPS